MKLYIVEVHFWADMVFMLQDNVVLAFVLIVWHNCSCLLCNTVFTNYALHSGDFVGFLLFCLYFIFTALAVVNVVFFLFFFKHQLLLYIILFCGCMFVRTCLRTLLQLSKRFLLSFVYSHFEIKLSLACVRSFDCFQLVHYHFMKASSQNKDQLIFLIWISRGTLDIMLTTYYQNGRYTTHSPTKKKKSKIGMYIFVLVSTRLHQGVQLTQQVPLTHLIQWMQGISTFTGNERVDC